MLFIITSDPRASHRPAEAIRIAAGVGVWKAVEIWVYLRGSALHALGDPHGLADEDNYDRYLPILAELGRPIYVQQDAEELISIAGTAIRFEELSDEQLAKVAAESTYLLRF